MTSQDLVDCLLSLECFGEATLELRALLFLRRWGERSLGSDFDARLGNWLGHPSSLRMNISTAQW
jgi:hypothetical protein